MTPQIVASLSSLAPKIREVGSTLAAALSEGLAGDTSRLVKIGELMGEAVALGLKVAITRTLIETEESIRRFLENLPGIKQIYGFDPFDQAGEKPSEYIRKGKGRVTEGQIEDGIARIQSIFEEISIDSNPKLGNPNLDSFNEDQRKRREARGANKPILPTEPDTPEGPSDKQKAKAEELRLAQEAYRLEAEMVRARIAGNEKKIADLERQKAIQEEIVALNKLGMTGKDLKADSKLDPKKAEEKARERIRQTAAKMVDARAAADEADKAREKKQQGGPSAGVSQLGSVAKATNVLMGRAANDGILEESRRQTSLLRTIKENTKPKTTNPPEVPIPVFA
jgi:phage terminase small subunit